MQKQTFLSVSKVSGGFVASTVEGTVVNGVVLVEMFAPFTPVPSAKVYKHRATAKKGIPLMAAAMGISFIL